MPRQSAKLYASVQLIQIARDGVRASEVDTLAAIAGIVFSALALEAIVNELLDRVRDPVKGSSIGPVARLLAVARAAGLYERHTAVEGKIQIMAAALNGSEVSSGSQPFQDCNLLIQIRNHIVHTRPETREQSEDGTWPMHKILQRLVARKILRTPTQVSATIYELQNYAVAKWAFETMVATIQELVALFPLDFRRDEDLEVFYGVANLAL